MTRCAYAIFCDDIRPEVGNKNSLMGIYAGDLFVPAFPHTIFRLGISIGFQAPASDTIQETVIEVSFNGDVILTAPVPIEQIRAQSEIRVREAQKDFPGDSPEKFAWSMFALVPPMNIERASMMRAEVIADGQRLLAGKLRISVAPQVES